MKSAVVTRFNGKSRLDIREWAKIADAYSPRFKVAVLARIAVKARANEQDAAAAMSAYQDAVRQLKEQDFDIETEARKGMMLIGLMNATINAYFRHYDEIELTAPNVPATVKWQAKLGKAAKAFVDAYNDPAINATDKSMTRADIDRMIEEGEDKLNGVLPPDAIGLRDLAYLMGRIALFSPMAQEEIEGVDLFADGSSQRRWINDLTKVCKRYDLPVSAANEFAENYPFVRLVSALLERMPPRLSDRSLEYGPLAQAIKRARKSGPEKARKRERAIRAAENRGRKRKESRPSQ